MSDPGSTDREEVRRGSKKDRCMKAIPAWSYFVLLLMHVSKSFNIIAMQLFVGYMLVWHI